MQPTLYNSEPDRIRRVAERISGTKKYRSLYPKTVVRAAAACLPAQRNERDAARCAKNLLHRIWGAYYAHRPNFAKLAERIEYPLQGGGSLHANLSEILAIHASSRERLTVLNEFYPRIFAKTGVPRSIADHACCLNPLMLPWMRLPPGTVYRAYDIDAAEIAFLKTVCPLIAPEIRFEARLGDVLVDTFPRTDIALLLKLLPLLEDQATGASLDALQKIEAGQIVVSFPAQSLSGGKRRMGDFYGKWFEKLIAGEHWPYEKIMFPHELVFVVKKI